MERRALAHSIHACTTERRRGSDMTAVTRKKNCFGGCGNVPSSSLESVNSWEWEASWALVGSLPNRGVEAAGCKRACCLAQAAD
eukprot:504946-Pelagomonas_calceolata.AAC.5